MIKLDAGKFDNDFINTVEQLANALKVDPVMFIENIVLSRMAADQAADDVYQGGLQFMPEFLKYDGQQLRGRELYKMIYNLKRAELEREIYEQLKHVPKEDIHRLSEHDQDIIRRYASSFSAADIKAQLAEENDSATDTSWTADIKPEDMK
jgi:hypothetical protein